MKRIFTFLTLLICLFSFAQVPDTVRHLSDNFSGSLKDFDWNSPNSFMAVGNSKIYRWSWQNDTTHISLPNHSNYNYIKRLTAGEFIVLGENNSYYGIASKIDSAGNVIWQRDFTKNNKQLTLEALFENSDGSLIVAGGNYQVMLAKLNSNGDTTKVMMYPVSSFNGITDIIKLSDGNFLGGGYLDDYAYAVKFTPALDTLWTYTSSNFISFNQMRLVEESNGNLGLFASNHLITLSPSGSFVSDSIISKSYLADFISYNNDMLAVGRNKSNSMPGLFLFDNAGDSLDSRSYHHAGFRDGAYVKVKKLRDGKYAALGYAKDSAQLGTNIDQNFISILGTSVPTGFKDHSVTFSIYPNPVHTGFIVEGYKGTIDIMDIRGKVIRRGMKSVGGTYSIKDLSAGTYLIYSDKGEFLGRIMK